MKSNIYMRHFSKKLRNLLRWRKCIGKGMKILEIFGENRLKFVEKWKIIKIWRKIFIVTAKLRNLLANPCTFATKSRKTLKNLKKILTLFDQNLYGKLTFSPFFLNISGSSDLSETIYFWKIRARDVPAFLPLWANGIIQRYAMG